VHTAVSDPTLMDWLAAAGASARRVASVCNGTFLLAAAGLLDGRRVTTHWLQAEQLARQHPAVIVDREPIFIRDGRIWTSAGVTAGMDLALALVEDDVGAQAALEVARELVLFLRRPGNQSQFSTPLWSRPAATDALRVVVDAIDTDPGGRHDIAALAAPAKLSPRHFQRKFTREIGTPPYVERVRVEAAQRALAERDDPVDSIARRCGSAPPRHCGARSTGSWASHRRTTGPGSGPRAGSHRVHRRDGEISAQAVRTPCRRTDRPVRGCGPADLDR